jgi:hypothetical protein
VEEKSNFILKVDGDPNGITALFKIPGTSEYSSFFVCTELLVWTCGLLCDGSAKLLLWSLLKHTF